MTNEPQHDDAPHRVTSVVQHLVHCRPCRNSLATMDKREAAVAFLEAQANDMPAAGETTVDRVLRRTAFAGKAVFCDLVYELAKACLLSDEEFARLVKPVVAPRALSVIEAELEATAHQVAGLHQDLARACEEIPAVLASREVRLKMATDLVAVLTGLEGESARLALVDCHLRMAHGDFDSVPNRLEPVLHDARTPRKYRELAAICVARVRLMHDENEALELLLKDVANEGCGGPILAMYGVANAAVQGEHALAESRLSAMTARRFQWTNAHKSLAPVLAQVIATELGTNATEIVGQCGVPT